MAMTLQVVRALREPRLSRALVCRFAGCVSAPSVIASLTEAPVTAAMLWMLRRRVVTAHERAGEASGPWLRVRAADLSGRGLSDHELTAAAFLRRILETFAPVFDGTAGRGAWDLRELGPRPSSRWARGYAADCLDRLGSARGWTDRPALLAA